MIFNSKIQENFFIEVLPFLTLGLNFAALVMLIVLFFYRNKVEARSSSLFLENITRQEMFNKLRKATTINEGKFIFYFIWGANIDCEISALQPDERNKSNLTEDYTEDLDVM